MTSSRSPASCCWRQRRRPCSPQPAPSNPPSQRAGGSPSPTGRASRIRGSSSRRSPPVHAAERCGRDIATRPTTAPGSPRRSRAHCARPGSRPTSSTGRRRSRCCGSACTLRPMRSAISWRSRPGAKSPRRPHSRRRGAHVTGWCRCAARAPMAGSTPAKIPDGCATPTGRSRRSCTWDRRPRTPTRRGSPICCAAHFRRRSPSTSRWAAELASRRGNVGGGSGWGPRGSTRSTLPAPPGRLEPFQRTVQQTPAEFHALTNARVIRGRRLCLPGFTSTLPLGIDELRATRSYAQRNIAHCVALTSSRCGSPGGVIVGTADPGGTLERADPFDPVHPRRVTLIVGPSGGGKTVLTNALCLRYIAQGGRTFILDRSSTPDEHGNTQGTGHYDTLASLIPGSRRVQVGHAGGDVICPWDVSDAARVPAHKTELLLALHALLIGHAHDPEGRVRTLDSDEETLIRTGIEAAYRLSTETGERPREQLLIDVLADRAAAGTLTGANADRLQSLLLRLEPYGEAGSLAHIADQATTVPADTPLTVFDFTGLSERLTPALMLATVEYVERQVQ